MTFLVRLFSLFGFIMLEAISGSWHLEAFKSFPLKLKSGIKKGAKVKCIKLSSFFDLISTVKELIKAGSSRVSLSISKAIKF